MELAEIDSHNQAALSDAENLLYFSSAPITFIAIGFVLGAWVPEWTFSFGFIALVCLGVFWFKYFRWSWDYSGNRFPDEVFIQAQLARRRSLPIALLALILLVLLLYVRIFYTRWL